MLPVEQLSFLMERLREKDRILTEEIRFLTSWIAAHRKGRRPQAEKLISSLHGRREYYAWRRVSCYLHRRRSELKTQREKIRTHLLTMERRIEAIETGLLNFPVFSDLPLEADLTPADACA